MTDHGLHFSRISVKAGYTLRDGVVHRAKLVVHQPRLLSDDVTNYISGDLVAWLQDKGMKHSCGAPFLPQTRGKNERRHQTQNNRNFLENYVQPGDPETQIEAFDNQYNHESLNAVTPADVNFGRDKAILQQRERIK